MSRALQTSLETLVETRQIKPNGAVSLKFATLEPRKLSVAASAHLDMIRVVAAWAVMWGHVRGDFFVGFSAVRSRNLLVDAFYFVTGFGHQAVMVFFVLSGFLISSSIFQSYASGVWSWKEYAINRCCRLYVVLVPSLLLGLLWDSIGIRYFGATGLYSHPLWAFGTAIPQNQLGPSVLAGNLFFVQTILCPTFGSNGPLWSLANEFWYYVMFPVALAVGIAWARRSRWALPVTLLLVCIGIFVGPTILAEFPIWLAGTALVLVYSKARIENRPRVVTWAAITSAVLAGCLYIVRTCNLSVVRGDYCVGIAFAIFLFGLLHDDGVQAVFYQRSAHLLAGFSYTLYLVHFPILLLLRARIDPGASWQPDPRHLAYAVCIGVSAMVFAWAISTVTEARTGDARRRVKAILNMKST